MTGIRKNRSGSWNVRFTINGVAYAMSLPKGATKREALEFRDRARAAIKMGLSTEIEPADAQDFQAAARQARKRAVQTGKRFSLTPEQIDALISDRCALTGICFTKSKPQGATRAPYAPSLDRIDSAMGYEPGNVRFVIWAVNNALGEWGENVFDLVATQYLMHRGRSNEDANEDANR